MAELTPPPIIAASIGASAVRAEAGGARGFFGLHGGRVALVAILLPILVLGGLLFFFNPSEHSFFPVCHFHETTGLLCAGCGASRAIYYLLHGHLATAFRFNPLLVLSLPLIGWGLARYAVGTLRNQPTSLSIRPMWLWLMLVGLVAFTVVRNLPGLPEVLRMPEGRQSVGLRTGR